ncbi:hypothetical protein TWF696_009227 [Orbilia brochopaga]|uniref:Domain of unknown function at the cortex 1 domain-containing protein n=1 Tax=Orbilia brochopaga TaxID=3140254 RepID=A0AAV9UF67_9PEZI
MPRVDKYTLAVTAGPSRDPATHVAVPVNTERPVVIETELVRASVHVRIQGFRNTSSLPTTSPYFTHPSHTTDKYSLSIAPLSFTPHAGAISGDDLVLANDFDRSISQSLPPGFSVAWRVARWVIDPGLDGDPWAEKPWMEGRVLSSVNVLDVGERNTTTTTSDTNANTVDGEIGGVGENRVDILTEGLHKAPLDTDDTTQTQTQIPETGPARMKFFIAAENRRRFTFRPGEKYWLDFFNPYLDFNDFALRLPGISIHILQYWDGQPLRYVLKNRVDGTVYLVVQFTLTPVDGASDTSDDTDTSDDDDNDEEEDDEEGEGEQPNGDDKSGEQARIHTVDTQDDVD